jgi:hypothetical protein
LSIKKIVPKILATVRERRSSAVGRLPGRAKHQITHERRANEVWLENARLSSKKAKH